MSLIIARIIEEIKLVERNINPLTSNDLQRRRAVSPLKIKILDRQRCAEGFNPLPANVENAVSS
jgi:hypothetical protein